MTDIITALILLAVCSCNGGKVDPVEPEDNVKTSPEALTFTAEPQTLTLSVNAGEAFQAYCNSDWVKVDPAYTAESSGEVKVTVSENMEFDPRSTELVIKAGTVRHKVPVTQVAATAPSIVAPEGYRLVWNDEFDKSGKPDESEWWYETGGGGWGNNELQSYVAQSKDGEDLASVSGGSLKITAKKIGNTVYSIRMNTRKSWTYGWFEAAIKVSDVRGSWPAFWMMPQNFKTWPGDGEIDIMEYAISTQGKNYSSSSIHCGAFNWPKGTQKTHKQSVSNAATEYHVYALEWMADKMVFYVDGKAHLTFENDGKGYDHWPFDNPFYLKFNMAWGGNMGGTTDEDGLPAVYEVDYVRVFQKK
ncbi:MAG: family 16 glycosylhydrolase [Bacteroidales bacterium]|nr:family 16 glycosylhydrolase [Bacteroidales bacterium]